MVRGQVVFNLSNKPIIFIIDVSNVITCTPYCFVKVHLIRYFTIYVVIYFPAVLAVNSRTEKTRSWPISACRSNILSISRKNGKSIISIKLLFALVLLIRWLWRVEIKSLTEKRAQKKNGEKKLPLKKNKKRKKRVCYAAVVYINSLSRYC